MENWFLLDVEERDALEAKCDAVISPKLWNEDGVRNRLEQLDKLSSPEACREIVGATGGWPILLNDLFLAASEESNLSGSAKELGKGITKPSSTKRASFLNAISIGTLPGALEVFNLFQDMESVEESDLSDLHQLLGPESGNGLSRDETLRVVDYFRRVRILHSMGDHIVLDPVVKRVHGVTE